MNAPKSGKTDQFLCAPNNRINLIIVYFTLALISIACGSKEPPKEESPIDENTSSIRSQQQAVTDDDISVVPANPVLVPSFKSPKLKDSDSSGDSAALKNKLPPNTPLSLVYDRAALSATSSPIIHWDPSASADILHYQISIGTSEGGNDVLDWTNASNTASFELADGTFSCPSHYFVSARATDGDFNNSEPLTSSSFFVFDETNPLSPTQLNSLGDASVNASDTLTWDAGNDNCMIDHYEIAVSLEPNRDKIIAGGDFKNLGKQLTGRIISGITLVSDTTYYTLLKTVDAAGNYSMAVSPPWQILSPAVTLPAMVAWLDASVLSSIKNGSSDAEEPDFLNPVSQWNDISASANIHNFTTSADARPEFEGNGIRMNGISNYFTTANHSELNTGTVTQRNITVAFKTGENVEDLQMIFEEGGYSRGMNIYINNNTLHCGFWNTVGSDGEQPFVEVTNEIKTATTYFVTWVFDYNIYQGPNGPDGRLECFVNGKSAGTTATTSRLFAHSGGIGFGATNYNTRIDGQTGGFNGNGHYFKGTLFELMLFNATPDSATVAKVHSYLSGKWP